MWIGNTQFLEFEPFMAPDESFLIFMAGGLGRTRRLRLVY
jgi:hypothetical protein